MNFCPNCGARVARRIPDGDHLARDVCDACGQVHYDNPKLIAGCVPEHDGRILLCRRAIEPRLGFWTIPAGFMEIGETLAEAAARECREEALAHVEIEDLCAIVHVLQSAQVHVMFRARLADPTYGVGAESLETRLYLEEAVPWHELAFPSVRFTLERWFQDRRSGRRSLHFTTIERRLAAG